MAGTSDTVVRFGRFEFDPLRRELRSPTGVVPLGSRAFDTLAALLRRHGETVDRDALMRCVWPGRIVEENNLAQAIRSIRNAFSAHAPHEEYIVTVTGRGYRFVAPLHRERSGHRYALAVLPLHEAGVQLGASRAEAFTDALVAALSAQVRMPVRSVGACAALPHAMDAVAAGRLLGVTHVVEGALHGRETPRLSIRLIEVGSGLCAWARVLELADEVLAVESIAQEICARLPDDAHPTATPLERRLRGPA